MSGVLTLEVAQSLCNAVFDSIKPRLKPRVHELFETRRKQLQATVAMTTSEQQLLTLRYMYRMKCLKYCKVINVCDGFTW